MAYANFDISAGDPFTGNLLRNNDARYDQDEKTDFGETPDGLMYWRKTGNVIMERTTAGVDPITESIPGVRGKIYNWATSHNYGALEQEVNLLDAGCSEAILDKLRPPVPIYASVWCAARWDCGGRFEMRVKLLDAAGKVLKSDSKEMVMDDHDVRSTWHKVETIFTDYKPGVRRILFHMGGTDTQHWAGYFGAKFALPCLSALGFQQLQGSDEIQITNADRSKISNTVVRSVLCKPFTQKNCNHAL